MKACFPDVLFQSPERESPKWTEVDGFTVKRRSTRKECTVETAGILEGMPIGSHYEEIDVDDLEDAETVDDPEQTRKVNRRFDLLYGLLTEGGKLTVWGTPYSHMGTYTPYLVSKTWPDGRPVFLVRKYAATEDGTRTGKLRLFSPDEWDKICATVNE